ncbi:MAG: hypothetical protein PHF34_03640 [Bacteroidales bacterium]|nr:hypothetical protein [Bacteroidales bacterium]
MKNKSVIHVLAIALFLLVSCAPVYSPYIYDQTADLKTRSLTIMNKATDSYSKHEKAVDQLKSDLESVLQQEKMRKHNQVKVKQWNLLLTTDGYLLNGTFAKWQRDTTMSENFVGLQCKLIGEAFDLIQETEKQRLKN